MTVLSSIGLMSGTSMDGIDAALLETDGTTKIKRLGHHLLPYDNEFRLLLKACEYAVKHCQGKLRKAEKNFSLHLKQYLCHILMLSDTDEILSKLIAYLYPNTQGNYAIQLSDIVTKSTELHALAVQQLLSKYDLSKKEIDVIGYHGQTLYHNPAKKITIQVGDGQRLAHLLRIQVVNNFRANDINKGGQGAPFAPLYHQALVVHGRLFPAIVINCGGIANLSAIAGTDDNAVIGFDTGPGNGLIDRFIRQKTAGREHMDKDGRYGLRGIIHKTLLDKLQARSCQLNGTNFYCCPPPKSIDINDLHLIPELDSLTVEDACATLGCFTAKTISDSFDLIPSEFLQINKIKHCILTGGGWNNPMIQYQFKKFLQQKFKNTVAINLASDMGWDNQALEAETFAFLAVRSLQQLPLSVPGTTNVPYPLSGGDIHMYGD